jgi:hypothetical protein
VWLSNAMWAGGRVSGNLWRRICRRRKLDGTPGLMITVEEGLPFGIRRVERVGGFVSGYVSSPTPFDNAQISFFFYGGEHSLLAWINLAEQSGLPTIDAFTSDSPLVS